MKRLSPIDAAFVSLETPRTPMNIGALMTFKLPPKAPRDYLQSLFQKLRSQPVIAAPFNQRLVKKNLPKLAPAWETIAAPELDIDYHLRHSALPYPGGERELGILVARLHSNSIDLTRPPWEIHLIEGLERRRFAMYFKAHHAAWDGIGALGMVKKWLSEDAEKADFTAPWAMAEDAADGRSKSSSGSHFKLPSLRKGLSMATEQVRSASELVGTLAKMGNKKTNPEGGAYSALETPRTPFNVEISPHRRLATQLYSLQRFKAISKVSGATVNDICLAICGAAVRRYLQELGELPDKPLIASMPIGLERSSEGGGNAVAGIVVPLPTLHDNLMRGLSDVSAVTKRSKSQIKDMSAAALQQMTLLGLSPLVLGQMSGLSSKAPPIFNLVVSNVVAAKNKLYLSGAPLEAMWPISVLFDGYALNVTIVGYADALSIGITGCRDALPSLQKIAVYTGEALEALEKASGITDDKKAPAKKVARKSARKRTA